MSYLALDVGDRRIGVAGADPEGIVVTPLTTFTRRSDRQVVAAITALAADRGVETIVVGLPYTPQGEIGEQAQRVQDFARRLEQVPGLTVVYWDERYSTLEASDRLRETGGRRRRRGRPARIAARERLDAAAAAVILQDYLDARHEAPNNGWSGARADLPAAIATFQGPGQFGPAYEYMLAHDTHAPGSVDRVLMAQMIQLCRETATYLYTDYTAVEASYEHGSRPELEQVLARLTPDQEATDEGRLAAITRFASSLQEPVVEAAVDELLFGGTEEQIIARGSDWCTDVARVACVLCQIAGLPARLVQLFNLAQAYSGHVVIEVYSNRAWGAVDPLRNHIYRHRSGCPASTWDLMNNPSLVTAQGHDPGQLRGAAITNYFVTDWWDYDFTVSQVNDYCRSILTMANRGWPGGLRWLCGEDTIKQTP